ncbi:hypothetical protein LguiB_035464 [Lonicera macranthoides]
MEGKKSNKRRTHRRKPPQDRFINIAEARREIVHFLHLHRSSPSPTNATTEGNINITSNIVSVSESSHPHQHQVVPMICCYPPLIESLPVPGPTWSTTAPSVLDPPPPPPLETLEFFDCHENLSSSYAWWNDFLHTLDCKRKTDEVPKFPPAFEEIKGRNGKGVVLGQWQFNVADHHSSSLHGNDHADQICSCLDEWFTVPSSEDRGE